MQKFSEWNVIDLHIHSKESNKVKKNDYDGEEYSALDLLNKLVNNGINVFSVTDHNCINKPLYQDLKEYVKKEEYNNKIDFVVGVELDINDPEIYSDVFHCLCFFDTRDIDLIEKSIDDVFKNKALNLRDEKENYPTISFLFKKLAENGIQNILLIPHYNNKKKGLPSNIAIDNLNYLCFNAYEDSNNIKNVQKSLDIYKKAGYDNFPFAVFTDNHNLNIYPNDKNGNNNEIKCYILGNINDPFNAIKTAFQEAKMRISLSNIQGMRSVLLPEKYINKIIVGSKLYNLSPYQNTIIGKFGSGKSLLLKKIKDGSASLYNDKKYNEFYDENEKSKIFVDTQQYNSLNELSEGNYKIYEFIQQESYYYKNDFSLDEATKLFEQLNIKHIFNNDIRFVFNKESIINSFNDIKKIIEKKDGKNNLNYERAFDTRNYYSFITTYSTNDIDSKIEILNNTYNSIECLKNIKLNDNIPVFTENEINDVLNFIVLISKKIRILQKYDELKVDNLLQKVLNKYNDEYVNNNAKDLKDILISDIDDFKIKLKSLKLECEKFELILSNSKYQENKSNKTDKIIDNYSISWNYSPEYEYKSIIDELIKSDNRSDNLFKSIVKTLTNKVDNNFSSNKDFNYHISKYITYANGLFTVENVKYDILKDGKSMLKRSAGEKSSLFIEFIFDLLEKDLLNNIGILLILDQPEDNIDNDNIFIQISNRIRNLKYKFKNFQSIIVTHNANVAITADSENIIIANEILDDTGKKQFNYDFGCIENKKYIERVCKILEGGKQAMEKRTIKYGINIIRKVEENGI